MDEKKKSKKNLKHLQNELTNKNNIIKPNLIIETSDDNIEAYLIVQLIENKDNTISEKDIKDFLTEKNIVCGIREDLIPQIVSDINNHKIKEKKYLIARGEKPVNSLEESIRLMTESGTLIMQGEIIGEYISSKKGKYGKNVYGKKIAPKINKKATIKAGKNVERINTDNKILYSTNTTGVVFLDEVENALYVEKEKDGDFSININNKGEVLLTINPPIGRKEPVTKKIILDEIINLKLSEIINQESLDKAVEIGKEDRIRDFVIGSKTPENYSININITDSNMTAYISIHRPIIPIQPITETMLMKEIIQAGIKKGILDKKIKNIIETINEKRESITDTKIAQGKKPVDDEEDFINFNINIEHKNQKFMIEDENDRQISKTGDIGEYVQAHTLLCQFVGGELKGNEGFTVTGEVLKPKRKKPKRLIAGKNVSKKQESNNRFDYYSQDEGNVYIYEDTIMVQKAK